MTETQTDPIRRGRFWLFADGTVLPVVSGGNGESEPDTSTETDADGTSEDDTGTGDDGGTDTGKLELTQAELDAMVEKRLGRARKQWEADAKSAADRAQMDEVERLKAEKADADKAAADALTKANDRLVASEAKVIAAAAGVKPEKLAHLLRLADLTDIDVSDDGEVDAEAVKAAVDKVLTDLPELASSPSPGRSGQEMGGGAAGHVYTRDEISKMSQAEYEKHEDKILEQMRTVGIK